jgi:hypothetical protein
LLERRLDDVGDAAVESGLDDQPWFVLFFRHYPVPCRLPFRSEVGIRHQLPDGAKTRRIRSIVHHAPDRANKKERVRQGPLFIYRSRIWRVYTPRSEELQAFAGGRAKPVARRAEIDIHLFG